MNHFNNLTHNKTFFKAFNFFLWNSFVSLLHLLTFWTFLWRFLCWRFTLLTKISYNWIWIQFSLHFVVTEKSRVHLFSLISKFQIILNFLSSYVFVWWIKRYIHLFISRKIYKKIYKNIWRSTRRILISRSRLWPVPYLVQKEQTFLPHQICLLILSIE